MSVDVSVDAALDALSPLDGRYATVVRPVAAHFSESSLIRARVQVEVSWLIFLADAPELPAIRSLTDIECDLLASIADDFSGDDARRVKAIERTTNHDVKAVEYFLKERLSSSSAADLLEWVHFACTSEDINNLSHALMLKAGVNNVWLGRANEFVDAVAAMATELAATPMLSRTHGQTASPTTVGKELAVFVHRWRRQLMTISRLEYLGKINGAVGNFNAHIAAFPDVDWPALAQRFVESLGLTYNPITTQIESHDYMAEAFHALIRFNNILLDFDRDLWSYISLGYFKQRTIEGEVGSSTMPHKVNPIDFENSEANVGLANATLEHLASKLAVSRLQRDLTDSSALRNMGVGIGYSYLALVSAQRGLRKLLIDNARLAADLDNAWEVLAEPIQTIMRAEGLENPYERLKALTRGQKIDAAALAAFVDDLPLSDGARARLRALSPAGYVGLAERLAREAAG